MAKKKKDENENNCLMEVDGDILTITIDLSEELGESGTGKSIMVAKTEPRFSDVPGDDHLGYYVSVMVGKKIKTGKKDKKDKE